MKQVEKTKINWSGIKTNLLVAYVALTVGMIGGYFISINVHQEARASVVSDMQEVTKAATQTVPKVQK